MKPRHAPRDKRAAPSAPVELALPGHWVRPLEGGAPQALRGWAKFTAPRDERAASSAPVALALPGHWVRPLEGGAPQALRGWAKFTMMGLVRAGLGVNVVPTLTRFHFKQPGLVCRPLVPTESRQTSGAIYEIAPESRHGTQNRATRSLQPG